MRRDGILVTGTVVEGHRVASAPSEEYPYPTLEKQRPYFKEGGLDLDHFFLGTLNVSITPRRFVMVKPAFTFRKISWTDLHPPEDFSFSPCLVKFQGKEYAGFVYYPHPETKIRDFQDPSVIEVITEFIPNITYGVRIDLMLDPDEIRIMDNRIPGIS